MQGSIFVRPQSAVLQLVLLLFVVIASASGVLKYFALGEFYLTISKYVGVNSGLLLPLKI